MTLDDTSEDKNRDFSGTIQELSLKSRILPNSRTRIIFLRARGDVLGAPRPEIGLWRTGEGNVCVLLGIGVRLFGGQGSGGRVDCLAGGDRVVVKQFPGGLLG
jgi:hypothetical protein